VTWDAIYPEIPIEKHSKYAQKLIGNAYSTLHPYWVLEYRRVANWSFAVGVARGHSPSSLLGEYPLRLYDKFLLWCLFLVTSFVALSLPISLFSGLKEKITNFLKTRQQGA